MRGGRHRAAAAVGLLCLLALGSCGGGNGGDSGTGAQEEGKATPQGESAALEQADANCRQMLRDVEKIAVKARGAAYGTSLVTVTESLAKPATRLVKQVAGRQRALVPAVDDPQFHLYVHLFDPIVVLAEERVRAGQAEDAERSQQLQYLLTNLGDEQRLAAHRAGLRECEVDFFAAMVRASGG
jgi:hypothetical protein